MSIIMKSLFVNIQTMSIYIVCLGFEIRDEWSYLASYVVVKDVLHDIIMNLNIVFSNIWETWTHNPIYQVQSTYQ